MSLIPIADWKTTDLAALPMKSIYRLIRQGALPCVRVGRRVFLTESGIAQFIAAGGAGAPIKLQRGQATGDALMAGILRRTVRILSTGEPIPLEDLNRARALNQARLRALEHEDKAIAYAMSLAEEREADERLERLAAAAERLKAEADGGTVRKVAKQRRRSRR